MRKWISKRKFKTEDGKEFQQFAIERLKRDGETVIGRSLGFDLNLFWKPRVFKTLYRWGTVSEKSFLFVQYRVLNIRDAELFKSGDEEVLGVKKAGDKGYVRFGR